MLDDENLRNLSRSLFLSAFSVGTRVGQWQIDRLAPTLEERQVSPGTVLFREGDIPDFAYFMEGGEVELTRAGTTPLVMKGKWIIGVMECNIELRRLRTATMRSKTRLIAAPAGVWRGIFEDDFWFVRNAFLGTSRAVAALYARLTTEHLVAKHFTGTLDLPEEPLDLVERLLALSVSNYTRMAGMQALTALAESATEARYATGRALAAAGTGLGHMLLSGTLVGRRVGHGGSVTIGPGSFLPQGVLYHPENWELENEGELRVLSFRPETMLDELEEHQDLVRSVLGTLWREREWLLEHLVAPEGKIVLG
ncbi:MAG: hypothetical protein HOO96_26840 [Polyangiaceae bacterium]|nr:hypothetical protein [Polyangiaceae bacterium]